FLRRRDPVTVYPFIEAEKAGRRNVRRACALLKVSRAAFYAHLAGPSPHERQDAELTGQIQAVHEQPKGRYGAPRAPAEPRRAGPAGAGGGAPPRRGGPPRRPPPGWGPPRGRGGRPPGGGQNPPPPPPPPPPKKNQPRRAFTADASKVNARWCGDITYIGTWE